MSTDLQRQFVRVATAPGVYLMKDVDGRVIYVGKAANLKKRLAAYFRPTARPDPKTTALIAKIAAFETIVTDNEKEALILESNLIKRHRPRYNVILKDDKRYPCLRLNRRERYPRLEVVRRMTRDGSIYFGPFSSAQAVRQTLKIVNKTFKLRKCSLREFRSRTRPCLHYQMQRCLGPCCLDVDSRTYTKIVDEVVLFLKGRTPRLIRRLEQEMRSAADQQAYEKAADLRDRIQALHKTLEKQVAVTTDFADRDVFGVAACDDGALVTMLTIRGGFLLGRRHFAFQQTLATRSELLSSTIRQYYERTAQVPFQILINRHLEDAALVEEQLCAIREGRVTLRVPQRGQGLRLTRLAVQNAEVRLREIIDANAARRHLLERLQQRLALAALPRRIECFDNSNISGQDAVSAMVVFMDGQPYKSAYRRYTIRHHDGPDDYAHMAEALKRRFSKAESDAALPDLLMLDGGKGQLNIALAVMRELNISGRFGILGIAKKDAARGRSQDKIYLPGRANAVNFGRDADLLLFLQQVRDEAHRFAIGFHRRRHRRSSLESALDGIAGIGPKRKKILLAHFGSVRKIRAATCTELCALPGMSRRAARQLKEALAGPEPGCKKGTTHCRGPVGRESRERRD